jgi:signal transduction histidine kinase
MSLLGQDLVETLAARSLPEAETAGKLVQVLRGTLKHVRTLSRGLVPVEVDAEGLMVALGDLAATTSELYSANCTFACATPVLVENNTTATNLYRIAREAVTNSLKHGRPRTIEINLATDDRRLVLCVWDDGIGIQESPGEGKGMGLKIMRYRAVSIGASLTIQPAEEGGTLLTCTLVKDS